MRALAVLMTVLATGCDQRTMEGVSQIEERSGSLESEPLRHADESKRVWRLDDDIHLRLTNPDFSPTTFPHDIPVSLECTQGRLTLSARDIILWVDAGMEPPMRSDFVAIEISREDFRLTGILGEESTPYEVWATGVFSVGKGDLLGLEGDGRWVISPIFAAHREARFANEVWSMSYPAPPKAMRERFVRACEALNARMY